MLRKLYLTICLVSVSMFALAQSGALKGTVTDKKTNEPIPFAAVVVELNGSQAGVAQTDFDGNYTIKPLAPGKYSVKAAVIGYAPMQLNGVVVFGDKIAYANIQMASSAVEIKTYTVEEYKVPLISKDNTTQGATIQREDIAAAPTRDVNSIVSQAAGVSQADDGKELNIRGGRGESTTYYVDGIKVIGSAGIPQNGIEQISVITGGVPAQYGDATSGIISITTRGPAKVFTGGVEGVTSQLFDKYGYNLVSGSLSGPLYTKHGEQQPLLGFFVTGEYKAEKDPSPSAIGAYVVKADKLADLRQNPLFKSSAFQFNQNAAFLTLNDLDKVKAKENVNQSDFRLSGKVDYRPSTNTYVSVGGTFEHEKQKQFSFSNQLLNSDHNREFISDTWRTYAKFTQKFAESKEKDAKSASVIKNAFYTLQADYSKSNIVAQDPTFKDNFFKYGYIGQFNAIQKKGIPVFKKNADTTYITRYKIDSLYTLGAVNEENMDAVRYTQQVFDFTSSAFPGGIPDIDIIRGLGGNRNGDSPYNIYSLFRAQGTILNGYQKIDNSQFRITASGSADIKNHNIMFGLEYEQRTNRGYTIAPVGLWSYMRLLANRQVSNFDTSIVDLSKPREQIITRKYDANSQSTFDKNLRASLGRAIDEKETINIDGYGPETYNLGMFSASELIGSDGKGPLGADGYYGFDYTGKKIDAKQDFEKYFTDSAHRSVGAWQPNYIAGYVQDKFAFNDLFFNIGLRIDRYDANQKVLKDKYILADYRTAGDAEVASFLAKVGQTRPSNIGDDYAVYLDNENAANASKVIGYRSGDKFYDQNGTYITDPLILTQGSTTIKPFLVDPQSKGKLTSSVFKDYEAQVNFMPRISFSFPISDEALFFAHYDVLTKRPGEFESRLGLGDYYFLQSIATDVTLSNPDLKPEKTIDYELGFTQKLTPSSKVSISGFYRELRDMVQLMYIKNAYPIDYRTYGNRDFGTIKGLSLSYDLRRTNNVRLTGSYTLQFADATGSGTTSVAGLTKSDPEIRTPLPVNFDVRHNVVVSVDYRYGAGEDYNGPVWFGKKFFENAGANIVFRYASGTPYTRQEDATSEGTAGLGSVRGSFVLGSINGARLPDNFRIDAKVDKDFDLKWKRKSTETTYKGSLNVYLQLLNVLDIQNVIAVYRFTGSPTDDGWLASSAAQADIKTSQNPQSYQDLYAVKTYNPFNYSLPRRIRLGAILSF